MISMHKILVPTDLSACSTRALQEAQRFALTFSATLDLLYVWSLPTLVAPESVVTGLGINQQPLLDWIRSSARELLTKLPENEAKSAGIAVGASFCEPGDPATTDDCGARRERRVRPTRPGHPWSHRLFPRLAGQRRGKGGPARALPGADRAFVGLVPDVRRLHWLLAADRQRLGGKMARH